MLSRRAEEAFLLMNYFWNSARFTRWLTELVLAIIVVLTTNAVVTADGSRNPKSTSPAEGKGVSATTGDVRRVAAAKAYSALPLGFEPNQGQVSGTTQFIAHGAGYSVFVSPGSTLWALETSQREDVASTSVAKMNPHRRAR